MNYHIITTSCWVIFLFVFFNLESTISLSDIATVSLTQKKDRYIENEDILAQAALLIGRMPQSSLRSMFEDVLKKSVSITYRVSLAGRIKKFIAQRNIQCQEAKMTEDKAQRAYLHLQKNYQEINSLIKDFLERKMCWKDFASKFVKLLEVDDYTKKFYAPIIEAFNTTIAHPSFDTVQYAFNEKNLALVSPILQASEFATRHKEYGDKYIAAVVFWSIMVASCN